jgi:hypothetical protein
MLSNGGIGYTQWQQMPDHTGGRADGERRDISPRKPRVAPAAGYPGHEIWPLTGGREQKRLSER